MHIAYIYSGGGVGAFVPHEKDEAGLDRVKKGLYRFSPLYSWLGTFGPIECPRNFWLFNIVLFIKLSRTD